MSVKPSGCIIERMHRDQPRHAARLQATAAKQTSWCCRQVFQEGLRILTEGSAGISKAGEDEALREERRAWHADAQARVRGLVRRWHVPVAPLVPRLDREVFSEEAASADTRADMLTVLHL